MYKAYLLQLEYIVEGLVGMAACDQLGCRVAFLELPPIIQHLAIQKTILKSGL
jgi:hypothetical protein